MTTNTTFSSNRFTYKELTEKDVNLNYLKWFSDKEVQSFISSSSLMSSLGSLKEYVAQKAISPQVLFWGIFNTNDMKHIGNIKYEPIDVVNNTATMGILIGDLSYRGKGVAKEAIISTSTWLRYNKNIHTVFLGVENTNYTAIALYERIGFKRTGEKSKNGFFMELNTHNLIT